ncbi:MAG: hypothetical protein MUO92_04405 [Dehalococcoidales bacterium]|nr:hypothetical protein [Dehalococcoidales bacterium]
MPMIAPSKEMVARPVVAGSNDPVMVTVIKGDPWLGVRVILAANTGDARNKAASSAITKAIENTRENLLKFTGIIPFTSKM